MSNDLKALRLTAALTIGLALALPVSAKTYCCTDKAGRRVCGDTMPEQCADRAYKEFGEKGGVRNIEAPLTAEQKLLREAEAAKKAEAERAVAEQKRKDRALLNTYGNERDLDLLRDRAVADLETAGKQNQDKYEAALKRKKKLEGELEFYVKKPVPTSLKEQIKDNEIEIAAQKQAIEDRKKEIEATRAKFEEDRKRYRELTGAAPAAERPR